MGNDYRVKSAYYGGYPAGYLRRIRALFPEKRNVLHLFSGKVDVATFPGDTVDINPANNPTYVDDAQTLQIVPLERYDLILADPPYSVEDAERYQTTMVKRNRVMRALQRAAPGAHVVWLDQVLADVPQGRLCHRRRDRHGQVHQPPVPRGDRLPQVIRRTLTPARSWAKDQPP